MITPDEVTVVGLGYVGLPLALAFAAEVPTTGYDYDGRRVDELKVASDRNLEVASSSIESSSLSLTNDPSCITDSSFVVVTVPTPVTSDNQPDLSLLESASMTIGQQLSLRSQGLPVPVIVFESTTYPGCTEEFCGPIIERESGLTTGEGFLLGYSPERTNFGDQDHTLESVVKVVSGQTERATQIVSEMYSRIAKAGVHVAPNIKTAEASKVIENVQRDLNIALFNEASMIFDRMGINSADVYDAASTKWNFHRYQPGLVGGHCIPVDPYYLTFAAEKLGYSPDVILAGRSVNEGMVEQVARKIEELTISSGRTPVASRLLFLGQSFKSDVADFRNSKAIDLADQLQKSFGSTLRFDPYEVDSGKTGNPIEGQAKFDVLVLAVGHSDFFDSVEQLLTLVESDGVVVDLTGKIAAEHVVDRDFSFWRL